MRGVIFFVGYFLCASCAKSPTPPPEQDNAALVHRTAHFEIHYTTSDRANLARIAEHFESNYLRIVRDLAATNLPVFQVYFYLDQQQLHNDIGIPNAPSWVIGTATNATTLRMMSPNWPSRDYNYMLTVAVHEFTHCVTLNLAPHFANHPRWLWEAVAIYAAGQFVAPSTLAYMTNGHPPTLAELDANWQTNTQIYDLGYVLVEYLVAQWGLPKLVALINSYGDIPATLGIATQEFESGWYAFVKSKYL